MRRYRARLATIVEAERFDDPSKPPKGVLQGRDGYALEVIPKKEYLDIEVGDWVVVNKGRRPRVLNHETFTTLYETILDVDIEDVSEEYRTTGDEAQ